MVAMKNTPKILRGTEPLMLDRDKISEFSKYLYSAEISPKTVKYYMSAAKKLGTFLNGSPICRGSIEDFIEHILPQYTVNGTNGVIAGLNKLFDFLGCPELRVAHVKSTSKKVDVSERELTLEDIPQLIASAKCIGTERGELILRTVFATGINASEVVHITIEAVKSGKAEIPKKDRIREVIIPDALCVMLCEYAGKSGIIRGPIFLSKNGRPLCRVDIFREIKTIAESSGIDCNINPLSLRKLFGRTYYSNFSNLLETVDVLGNKSVATGVAFVPIPSKDGYRENLNKLFTTAQGEYGLKREQRMPSD